MHAIEDSPRNAVACCSFCCANMPVHAKRWLCTHLACLSRGHAGSGVRACGMTAGVISLALCETRREGPVATTADSQGPNSFARIPGIYNTVHRTHAITNVACPCMIMFRMLMY